MNMNSAYTDGGFPSPPPRNYMYTLIHPEDNLHVRDFLQGRLYQEKMSADRTEMLYWLQQERRAAVLQPATVTLDLPHPVATITSV